MKKDNVQLVRSCAGCPMICKDQEGRWFCPITKQLFKGDNPPTKLGRLCPMLNGPFVLFNFARVAEKIEERMRLIAYRDHGREDVHYVTDAEGVPEGWDAGDYEGEDYCQACAEKRKAELEAETKVPFTTYTASGGAPETDGSGACMDCGKPLNYCLTDEGLAVEAEHYKCHDFLADPRDCFEYLKMLEAIVPEHHTSIAPMVLEVGLDWLARMDAHVKRNRDAMKVTPKGHGEMTFGEAQALSLVPDGKKMHCITCNAPFNVPGGYAGTDLCGPCCTGSAEETLNEYGDTW